MTWTHYTFGRSRSDPAPRFRPQPPECAPARSLADLLEESTGLARAGAAAVCWDGRMAAVVQVHIAGTDIEGRPRSEVRIRERPADIDAFAGCCLALFHKRPIESEAQWDHATLEIADRQHDRLASPVLYGLAQLWGSTGHGALATVPAPTIGVREEAADVCLIIRAVLSLSGMRPPVVVAHSVKSFANVWASDKWWTLLVASDAPVEWGPPAFADVQRFIESNPQGFSELEYYGDKLSDTPSLERLQQAVFVSTVIEGAVQRREDGPTFVNVPQLLQQQQGTAAQVPGRVWEVIRGRLHALIASERFVPAPKSETRVHGYVGESLSVVLELGATRLDVLQRVRSLLGERVTDQVRAAIEEKLPAEEAISSASKTVAQQSNHVVKLRLAREQRRVIEEIRGLPPSAARRAELAALVCDQLKSEAPLDMFISARIEPEDRVATGLLTLAPRWSGPPEALQVAVSALDAEWLVQFGEAILMTARRVGAEAFQFWVPVLVEALLRAMTPPPRLIEALLRTNLVGPDDSAALIRHSKSATDFVRHRALQLWTSGATLMGLEPWLPRPTTALLEEAWDRLPEPVVVPGDETDEPPGVDTLPDALATYLWGYASRIMHDRPAFKHAREAAALVREKPDRMAVRALLHHGATWLPFARDLWLSGHGRLLEGVPFDVGHLEYIARGVDADSEVDEHELMASGTPSAMVELAAERLLPWLRAQRWSADWVADKPGAVEALIGAWQSNDPTHRRGVHRYAWSMIAARSPQPRPVWLDRAWNAWMEIAPPDESPVQFLRSFPAYLQVELVGLGHVSLAEVEIMPQTSLPLINVFQLRSTSYEAAVLYEIPVASTWSLVIALPPGVSLPEPVAEATGEQGDVLASVAQTLDEIHQPFCLGIWNHTALAWKEGRNAWVASDGKVVCLNTDREPAWYDSLRTGFGGEPAQRMLAVAAAMDAPDEMLEATPRAKIVRRPGARSGQRNLSLDLLTGGRSSRVLYYVLAAVVVLLGAMAFMFMGGSDAPESTPMSNEATHHDGESNGTPSAAAVEPAQCPFTPEGLCGLLGAQYGGASVYCEHAWGGADVFGPFVKAPKNGPRCLRRLKEAPAVIAAYRKRQQQDDEQLKSIFTDLTTAACKTYTQRGCPSSDGCADVKEALTDSVLNALAKRFARVLHNRSADRAVPDLTSAMAYEIEDPSDKSAQAWLKQAMPVSCAWRIVVDAVPALGAAEGQLAQDFDRLRQKLPSHQQMLAKLAAR